MIRLVTCDIDGTLLHGEETSIDTETLEEIRRLREKGILFCPASGRQYHSLRRLFAPVQDEIAYICENGSVVFGPVTRPGMGQGAAGTQSGGTAVPGYYGDAGVRD